MENMHRAHMGALPWSYQQISVYLTKPEPRDVWNQMRQRIWAKILFFLSLYHMPEQSLSSEIKLDGVFQHAKEDM